MNILLVEDEARVADFIQRGLQSEGWTVTVAADGEAGLELLECDSYDVVVLDLLLPGLSGQDVCRQMRARRNLTPVLMLSAMGKTDDRVAGLRLGCRGGQRGRYKQRAGCKNEGFHHAAFRLVCLFLDPGVVV